MGHEDAISCLDADLVHEREQRADVLSVNQRVELGDGEVTREREVDGPGAQDVPGLRFAVQRGNVGESEFAIGVSVNGKSLASIEQLHEQHAVVAVAGDVLGAKPRHRITGDGIGE